MNLVETPIPEGMEGELRAAFQAFRDHWSRAQAVAQGLDDRRFNQTPPDSTLGTWSVGHCLHHLNLIAYAYAAVLNTAIHRAREEGRTGRGPFSHGWLGNWMVRQMEPPVRRRYRAPRPADPVEARGDLAVNEVLDEFAARRRDLFSLLAQADGLALNRVRLSSPFQKLIRFDLGQAFALLAAHERRHLAQAEQVRAALD